MVTRPRWQVAAVLALSLGVALAGSTPGVASTARGGIDLEAKGRRLTFAQATALSKVLVKNVAAKGATFRLRLPLTAGAVTGEGAVDWVAHSGHLTFGAPIDAASGATEAFWTENELLLGGGAAGAFTARTPNLDNPLDRSIAIVTGLAATSPDNPVLLQQGDARWLGRDRIGSKAVDVYRSGGLVLWVGRRDGLIRRVAASLETLPRAVTIDIAKRGQQTITAPPH